MESLRSGAGFSPDDGSVSMSYSVAKVARAHAKLKALLQLPGKCGSPSGLLELVSRKRNRDLRFRQSASSQGHSNFLLPLWSGQSQQVELFDIEDASTDCLAANYIQGGASCLDIEPADQHGKKLILDSKPMEEYLGLRSQAAERRRSGQPKPWSENEKLQSRRFTNLDRDDDPGTAFIVGCLEATDDFGLRLLTSCAYRMIGTEDFWVHWQGGCFLLANWGPDAAKDMKAKALSFQGNPLTDAYNVPRWAMGQSKANLEEQMEVIAGVLDRLMDKREAIAAQFRQSRKWKDLQAKLENIPGIGEFYAKEISLDCMRGAWAALDRENFTPVTSGARRGLNEQFGRPRDHLVQSQSKATRQEFLLMTRILHAKLVKDVAIVREVDHRRRDLHFTQWNCCEVGKFLAPESRRSFNGKRGGESCPDEGEAAKRARASGSKKGPVVTKKEKPVVVKTSANKKATRVIKKQKTTKKEIKKTTLKLCGVLYRKGAQLPDGDKIDWPQWLNPKKWQVGWHASAADRLGNQRKVFVNPSAGIIRFNKSQVLSWEASSSKVA
jgi:hypothetical protein